MVDLSYPLPSKASTALRHPAIPAACILLALGALACGPGQPEPPEVLAAGPERAPDPGAPGPYPVGVTTVVLEDPSRKDPVTGVPPRTFPVEIWYPADESARGAQRDVYDLVAEAPAHVRPDLEGVEIPPLEQPAVRDAPVRSGQGRFPLIVFSHGNGGVRAQSFSYTAHLASHGYVVASPDHVGNTLYDLLHESDLEGNAARSITERPLDISAVIDAFEDGGLAGGRFDGLVDLEHIGITGHSLGGLTSLIVPNPAREFYDPRIDVTVPVTPAGDAYLDAFGPPEDLAIPVFYIGATEDRTLDYQIHTVLTWQRHRPPKGMAGAVGAGHFSFTEICELDLAAAAAQLGLGEKVEDLLNDGCGPENMPIERAHAINAYYGAAWFNVYLRKSQPTLERYLDPGLQPADVEFRLQTESE